MSPPHSQVRFLSKGAQHRRLPGHRGEAPALGESSPEDKPDKQADAVPNTRGHRACVNILQEPFWKGQPSPGQLEGPPEEGCLIAA